jgi:PEP-CTERM motif
MSEGLTAHRKHLFEAPMTNARKVLMFAVALALLSISPNAFADSTNMTLTGAGNNVAYGVYVGPYTATINGVSQSVICDDFSHESYIGESWNPNTSTMSNMNNVRFTGPNETQNYDEVAYLATILFGITNNNAEADAIQYAIWYINDPTDVSNAIGGTSFFSDSTDIDGVTYWLNQAANQTYTSGEFSNITIYTPAGNTNPQEFIAETPEPATILMLVMGLCAVAFLRRRSARFTPAF